MTEHSPADRTEAEVEAVKWGDGVWLVTLRRRHADFRADRYWSYCDLLVEVDPEAPDMPRGPLQRGDVVEVVLASIASAARPAEEPGYAFKLAPASEAPVLMPPRPGPDGWHAGLVQREEPPDGGGVIFHLGSGLTCYPDGALSPEGIEPPPCDGEWWELRFEGPHRVLFLRRKP